MVRIAKPILSLVFIAALCCLCLGGCASHQSLASTGSDSDPMVSVPEGAAPGPSPGPSGASAQQSAGALSFAIQCSEWVQAEDQAIIVHVVGTSATGEAVDQQYTAQPDKEYLVSVDAGEYDLSLLTGAPTKGHRLFKAPAQHVSFDGIADTHAELTLTLDAEAMKSRQPGGSEGQKTMLPGAA